MAPSVINQPRLLFTFLLILLCEFCCRSYAIKCYHCRSWRMETKCDGYLKGVQSNTVDDCTGSCFNFSFHYFTHRVVRKCLQFPEGSKCQGSALGNWCICNRNFCN